MKKKFLLTMIAMVCGVSAWAYDFKSGDLYYNITSDSTVEVTCQYGYGESNNYSSLGNYVELSIPETVSNNGIMYFVTSIGEYAFHDCGDVESVTIPKTVTKICSYAFRGCYNLDDVIIPNSVMTIADYAFKESGIKSIIIPKSVTSIGSGTFSGCTGMVSVTIPNSIISIGAYAFEECRSLKSITIPDSVIRIDDGAFTKCWGLASITIPNSVSYIGNEVFNDCRGLTTITIPNSVIYFGTESFTRTNLKYTSYDNALYIGNKENPYLVLVRAQNTEIKSCEINDQCRFINCMAFCDCYYLSSVSIPESITSIAEYAFCNCESLISVAIPKSVTIIRKKAFVGNNLTLNCDFSSKPDEWSDGWNDGCNVIWANSNATYVKESIASAINIYATGNTIVVENATDEIRVYSAMGTLVGRDAIHRVRAEIIVNNPGVYIVKTGNKTQKVVLP